MADKKISQLTAAAALTGSEPIPTVQGGVTVQTTAQDIADLAAGGGGSPAGSDTQIQYNNAGAFGADANFFRDLVANSTFIANSDGSDYLGGLQNENSIAVLFSTNTVTNNTLAVSLDIGNGLVVIGNVNAGNGTKITIDDLNEHIKISNLPAYDDDTAAGVGGLTAGMVYMTTGSGSAPLNTAGILMIKQ